ncbi:hypothetical protein IE53DRAFT_18961 [Violaceomyces palustris]|uniref:Uncharacterized protein n=1 Tax=Violaceomyces palustris TaxID=1673888 RepID=A0ACD0P205_9BASI|nr:hypothetical protein IE53DRAFT_18961 [Violaceomyces palustris]
MLLDLTFAFISHSLLWKGVLLEKRKGQDMVARNEFSPKARPSRSALFQNGVRGVPIPIQEDRGSENQPPLGSPGMREPFPAELGLILI